MNNVLARIMDNHTPRISKTVAEGPVKDMLAEAPEYISEIISSTVVSMVNSGLEYHGWRRLQPIDEFNKLFNNKDNKANYDIARSNIYNIELRFTFNGKNIFRYISLPFAERGNLIKISDTYYHVVPVLSDTVISPSHKEVFVRLMKDKLTFLRTSKNFIVNQEKVAGQVIYSNIYKLGGRVNGDNLGTSVPPISLYLLGKYGLVETFKRYFDIDNVIVTFDNVDAYRGKYRIYESTKIKPKGNKDYNYLGHDLKILIPNDKINEANLPFLDNFIFGIIYTFDILPELANDLTELLATHDISNEKLYWNILLGKIIFKNVYTVDKITSEMHDHFIMLDNYIDTVTRDKLREIAIIVESFFDTISVILSKYNHWLLNSKEYNSDINNRYIDVLYYILYDVILGFNKALFDINRKANKKQLSEPEVINIFNDNITTGRIYSIVKSQAMNITMNLADYSGDIMYPKITAILEDQSRGNGVKRGSKNHFPEPTRTLRSQDLILGSLLYLIKGAPTPRLRANLFLDYNTRTGRLIINDDIKRKDAKLNVKLLGHETQNQSIIESEQVASVEDVKL